VDAAKTGAGCTVWAAAWAEEKREFNRIAATPNKTDDTAEMVRIDERRKIASENALIRMLVGR
jgi:hypothetical protein